MKQNDPQYFLSKHAFMCVTRDYAVFLDVRKDKYSALPVDEALAVKGAVMGWPCAILPQEPSLPDTRTRSERVLQNLLSEGLITNDASGGKDANPVQNEQATSDFESLMKCPSRVTFSKATRFITAWMHITFALRTLSLEHSIERVRRRKAADGQSRAHLQLDALRPLVASYRALQPRFFSSANACLRNSLTLIEYLSLHSIYPTWVFGVRMDPWAAHSWVQSGPVVLNDRVEHVRTFTTILTI